VLALVSAWVWVSEKALVTARETGLGWG